ncbi:D-fructose 1,6-bisphosphatase [Archaeoglobus sulfaticallidus PM70-1]|uniref:fructose-bisphosphatase n=1 Tax=Archaeoglobus sulfaticallidus PM70-1 TaxID=387631 RepID=N0BDM9_9EURY|nr:inositol monophosphatase family protein [Archaeoglobus sulfaticallidus]AGK60352.1 D-fructose 1,6-bisphosphatase [Archaeoglobus sulfaticallidus PM70-1]
MKVNFLELCRSIRDEVKKKIEKIPDFELRDYVGMGKDGTPTKKVDKVAEDVAISILKEYDFKIVSEEAGVVGEGDIFVALDPVDGTFNATRKIPLYCISMCFSKSDRLSDAFFAYVSNLATLDEYYAEGEWSSGFAYKNEQKIKVSNKEDISICNAVFYYPDRNYGFKRIRIFGSSAIELCLVADSSMDCFIDTRGNVKGMLRIYDVSAGLFIAKSAGAKATDLRGNPLDSKRISMDERLTLVVANPVLHTKIINLLGS